MQEISKLTKKVRRYDDEFKHQAVRLYFEQGNL